MNSSEALVPVTQPVAEFDHVEVMADVLHAQMLADAPFVSSLKMVGNTIKNDVQETDNRIRTIGLAVLTAATQGLDRSRYMFVAVPNAVTSAYEATHNPLLAGLAGGATFFVWSSIVCETLNKGMREFPKTVETGSRTFPGLVSFFTDSLPGMESKRLKAHEIADHSEQESVSRIRKIGRSAITHIRRAGVGIGIGGTAYTASSVASGYTEKETTKEGLKVNIDTSGLIVALGTGITFGLDKLATNGHQDTARWLTEWIVENKWFWASMAGASIAATYIGNKLKLRKKDNKNELTMAMLK